jgi:hypothetical protein
LSGDHSWREDRSPGTLSSQATLPLNRVEIASLGQDLGSPLHWEEPVYEIVPNFVLFTFDTQMQEIDYADKTEPHFTAVGIAKVSAIGSTLLFNNPKRLYGRRRLDKDDSLFTKPSLVRDAIRNNPELEKELSCVEPRRAWSVRSNQPNGSYAGTLRRGFQQSAPL